MRTRERTKGGPRAPRVVEMDVSGIGRTGAPPEDWPGILAATLVLDALDGEAVDVALPGDQAQAVADAIAEELDARGAAGRVLVSPHRLGWHRVQLEASGGARRGVAVRRRSC